MTCIELAEDAAEQSFARKYLLALSSLFADYVKPGTFSRISPSRTVVWECQEKIRVCATFGKRWYRFAKECLFAKPFEDPIPRIFHH